MKDNFDPQRLKLDRSPAQHRSRSPIPRHKPGELFLRGPISWEWLCLAARQSGKALHVAIAIWLLVGIKKSPRVKLSSKFLRMLGVGRHSAYRGLTKLRDVNLIKVERHRGRLPIVTVLDIPEANER